MGLIEKAKDALHLNKDKTAGEAPLSPTTSSTPAFDSKKVMVIYVLGGPGAGKGTQCAHIVEDFGFVHLSAGDLLREEQKREGSTYGALISEHIRNGTIVPMEVTVKLLENAIRANLEQPHPGSAWQSGHGRFLVDGFPRKMDQAIKFDETVCMSSFVLFFNTTEEVMLSRLLERGKTSGREDDNVESIKKRFRTFVETSMPVVDKYRAEGKVISIDSTRPIEVVHADVQKVLREELTKRGLPEK
ncbi:Uridylate kinase, partial [Rhizoctonia solani]